MGRIITSANDQATDNRQYQQPYASKEWQHESVLRLVWPTIRFPSSCKLLPPKPLKLVPESGTALHGSSHRNQHRTCQGALRACLLYGSAEIFGRWLQKATSFNVVCRLDPCLCLSSGLGCLSFFLASAQTKLATTAPRAVTT